MDASKFNTLSVTIRMRQGELWRKIVQEFEVEDSLNTQVQTWIHEGVVTERAFDRHRQRLKAVGPNYTVLKSYGSPPKAHSCEQAVPLDSTQGALHR
jgi:hypothetical protein